MGIRRFAGFTCNRLLMRVDNSAGKGTSGMDKFGSVINRLNMKLGSKFLNSLEIKAQLLLKMLQRVIVVDCYKHSQKDSVEGNRGSLKNVAKMSVLFLSGVQLILRSGVLTVLDLNKVDVTLGFAEISRSVLSGVGGSAGGWLYC